MSRCPRNLRQLVSSSRQEDDEFLREKFEVLRSLAHDDRQEADMLRSRIDQQSELIAILRQRSDQSYERYESVLDLVAELSDAKEALELEVSKERKQREIIEQRFKNLNENHVQLISIKDEYKSENDTLRGNNERLKRENESLFNEIVQEKESQLSELQTRLREETERCHHMEKKQGEVEQKTETRVKQLEKTIKDLDLELSETNKSLIDKTRVVHESSKKFQEQLEMKDAVIKQLERDRDQMTVLSMERGKAIEEYQQRVRKLEDEILNLRKELESSKERFQTEMNEVSKDARIVLLTQNVTELEEKLEETKRAYEAYKKHTSMLLANEKQLNAKLRKFTL
ncbi:coiled-coil domain-containing protein 89-like [Corticium candelabrum]|uniref:coiled-coil domain-containing protein 89-like n=1 Tax=Corticium candelabrum TaxID=121492 RepID=UPI002E25486F|nr:coiled-coil domain-containing protein 89-like [Corticium candelabrum]